jgi:hypothetical protein
VLLVMTILGLGLVLSGCAADGVYPPADSITVTGTGEATGQPDVAWIQFGVNVVGEDIGTAVDESNRTIEQVTEELIQLGILEEEIRTTNFNVWPEDRFDPETGQPTGGRLYHVDSSLQAKVRDIQLTPTAIEAALRAGANNVFGLTYGIDDRTSLEAEARSKALTDAQLRAEQLAEELGVALGVPKILSEVQGGGSLQPAFLEAAFAVGGGPPLSPGELTIRVQVGVTYTFTR